MYNLSQLTEKLPVPEKIEMVAQGYAAWLTWSQELPGSIPETLQSFGGREVSRAGEYVHLMQKRLKSLKFFRDGALFLYFMTRSFFWILLGVLMVSTLLVGLGTYVGLRREMDWAFSVLEQRDALLQLGGYAGVQCCPWPWRQSGRP